MRASPRVVWPAVALALACAGIVALRTHRARPAPTFDARAARERIAACLESIRCGEVPLDYEGMPEPWGTPFVSDEHRAAWEAYLDRGKPRLRAFDALGDPDVHAFLLIGDGAPIAEPLRLCELFCTQNELRARALLALDRGDAEEAVHRIAQAYDLALVARDDDEVISRMLQATAFGIASMELEVLLVHPRWDAELAWTELAPRLRALVVDEEQYLAAGSRLARRISSAALALREDEWTLDNAMLAESSGDHTAELAVQRLRVLLLTLGVELHRARTHRWPSSATELAAWIDEDELRVPGYVEPLGVRLEGRSLRVGLVHSTFPPNVVGLTVLLPR